MLRRITNTQGYALLITTRSQLRELRAAKDRSEAALGDAEDRCDRAEAAAHDLQSQLRVRFPALLAGTVASYSNISWSGEHVVALWHKVESSLVSGTALAWCCIADLTGILSEFLAAVLMFAAASSTPDSDNLVSLCRRKTRA